MSRLNEHRKYQRCDNLVCKVLTSLTGSKWEDVELHDISAGGIKFSSQKAYPLNAKLYFDIYVYNMLSEFNVKVEGCVIRRDSSEATNVYAVNFENINKYQQVQLDELVKSKISIKDTWHPHSQDEICNFFPTSRAGRIKGARNHLFW
jgi:hypothetical protein